MKHLTNKMKEEHDSGKRWTLCLERKEWSSAGMYRIGQ